MTPKGVGIVRNALKETYGKGRRYSGLFRSFTESI